MKQFLTTTALIALGTSAMAGGLDRSGQGIGALFQTGNYAELSFGRVSPSITGGVEPGTGVSYSNVGWKFSQIGAAFKADLSDQLSYAIILDQPFGASVKYPHVASGNYRALRSVVDSTALTAVMRYKFSDNMSIHAGLRRQSVEGEITLSGAAFGGASGYQLSLARDSAMGYLIGATYEIPEIALRASVTYNSSVDHTMSSTEFLPAGLGGPITFPSSDVDVSTPESINIDFQTGISQNTLLSASIRYAKWSDFDVVSPTLSSDLADLGDSTAYSIGVGHRLNENWAVTAGLGYEGSGSGTVSALAPTNGSTSLGLGAIYTVENFTVSGGVRYVKFGDAEAQSGSAPAPTPFTDNSAVAVGVKFGINF